MVEISQPTGGNAIETRRCKILSIEAPNAFFMRDSRIEWLDTGERENKRWKAAKGVHQPHWVVAGPKYNAALRREAKTHRNGMGRWVWDGYLEEGVGV